LGRQPQWMAACQLPTNAEHRSAGWLSLAEKGRPQWSLSMRLGEEIQEMLRAQL